MPEFIRDKGSAADAARFNELPGFVRGYIEAAYFTNTGTGDDAESGLQDASFGELSGEALAQACDTCAAFQTRAAGLLALAYTRDGYDDEAAGRDFWYTRNGHGVGYWDRDALAFDSLGEKLSSIARNFGSVDLYRGDDGLIYFM